MELSLDGWLDRGWMGGLVDARGCFSARDGCMESWIELSLCWAGPDWTGMGCIELGWTGLGCIGQVWVALNWIGQVWVVLDRCGLY